MLSFFPRGVFDEILNLIESVSEGFVFLSTLVEKDDHYFRNTLCIFIWKSEDSIPSFTGKYYLLFLCLIPTLQHCLELNVLT